MLNLTEISENHNKFYRIELIQDDTTGKYFVWNRWGRGPCAANACSLCWEFQFLLSCERLSRCNGQGK